MKMKITQFMKEMWIKVFQNKKRCGKNKFSKDATLQKIKYKY